MAFKNRVRRFGASRVRSFLSLLIFNTNILVPFLTFLLENRVENRIKEYRDCVKSIFVSLLNPCCGFMHRFTRE